MRAGLCMSLCIKVCAFDRRNATYSEDLESDYANVILNVAAPLLRLLENNKKMPCSNTIDKTLSELVLSLFYSI